MGSGFREVTQLKFDRGRSSGGFHYPVLIIEERSQEIDRQTILFHRRHPIAVQESRLWVDLADFPEILRGLFTITDKAVCVSQAAI